MASMKSEQEIIEEAEQHFGPINPGTLLNALEAFYMEGADDENAGNVESPTGHFYRVDRWIVVTDSQGFKDIHTYDSVSEAENEFAQLVDDYAEWGNA